MLRSLIAIALIGYGSGHSMGFLAARGKLLNGGYIV
jgi:hypothetical protein